MSKSLIQVANPFIENVGVNGIIPLGSVQRRYGCNCALSGNAIEISGAGYYTVDVDTSIAPTTLGTVTIALYNNGVLVPGTRTSSSVSTSGNPTMLSINTTLRQGCNCDNAYNLTVVLLEGEGEVQNISMRVVKE